MKIGYGIIPSSKTRVRCLFCGVHIPKANRCIEQHVNGAKHKENLLLTKENGINLINEHIYCKPCKQIVEEDLSISDHIEIESHANWRAAIEDLTEGEFIKVEAYLTSEKEDLYCEVCNLDIGDSLPVLEKHVNSIKHRTNIVERLKTLNGIFPAENYDEVYCKICNDYIDNTIHAVLEHIDDDEEHMAWLLEMKDLVEDQGVSIHHYLASEYEIYAYCKTCDADIICDIQHIETHVHSEDHLNKIIDSQY